MLNMCLLNHWDLVFRCPSSEKLKYHEDSLNGTAYIVPSSVNQMFLKNEASLMNGSGSALVIIFGCISLLLLLAVVSIMRENVEVPYHVAPFFF